MAEPSLQLGLRAVWQDRLCRHLLWISAAVHLLLALSFHLSPDETHYALYAVHPQWSYFDHPPLVGWLQWVFAHLPLVGGSDVLMRLVPMAAWLLAAWLLPALTFVLQGQTMAPGVDDRLPMRASLLLWCLAPIGHLMGLALVPDVLLMPLVLLTMLLTWRLCSTERAGQWHRWLLLGLALGLCGLSKYTAVFIGLGAGTALLLAHGPRLLLRPGAWLAAGVALLIISPVLVWNAANDWISLGYQASHARGSQAWQLRHVAVFGLVQLLGYGVLLFLCIFIFTNKNVLKIQKINPDSIAEKQIKITGKTLSFSFGFPALLIMTYLAGRGSALPHWSVSAWLSLMPAAAWGLASGWRASGRARAWVRGLAAWQLLSCVGLLTLMLSAGTQSETGAAARSLPGESVPGAQFNPFADLYGWDAAARRARTLADQHAAAGRAPTLAVMNWTLDSRIAWYAGRPTRVVQRHLDQFGLWWGVLQPGDSALVVDWSHMSFAPPVGPTEFARCRLLEQQPVTRWGRQVAHFNFQLCENWQGPKETALDRRR